MRHSDVVTSVCIMGVCSIYYTRKPIVVSQRTPLSRADSARASEMSSCVRTPQKLGGIEEDILRGNICQLITQLCTHLFFFFLG